MKVAGIGEVMSRRRPPILRELFFNFYAIKIVLPKHIVLIMQIINITKNGSKYG